MGSAAGAECAAQPGQNARSARLLQGSTGKQTPALVIRWPRRGLTFTAPLIFPPISGLLLYLASPPSFPFTSVGKKEELEPEPDVLLQKLTDDMESLNCVYCICFLVFFRGPSSSGNSPRRRIGPGSTGAS